MFILGTMREGSTRVPGKMVKPFNSVSLAEVHLVKLEEFMKLGFNVGVAVYPGDKTLWDLVHSFNVPVIKRSRLSVTGVQRRSVELHFLDSVSDDNICWLNACQPFLKPSTVKSAIDFFYKDKCVSLTPVFKRFTPFWMPNGHPVNNPDPKRMATQSMIPLLEATHSFHIHPRKRLLDEDVMWLNKPFDPFLYIVEDSFEFFDIDTNFDFREGELIWSLLNQ